MLLTQCSILSLIHVILVSIHQVHPQSIGKCGADESSKFDEVSSKVTIIGNPGGSFPTNLREATVWCSTARDSVKFIKDFSKKCLDSLSRQVSSLIAYGIGKHQKKVCKSVKSRTEAGVKLKCLNDNYPKINQQMERYIDDYQKTIRLSDPKEKLVGLCCSFHLFSIRTKAEVDKSCSPEHSKYFQAFIKAFSSDAIDLLCNNYTPENDACKTLVLPPKEAGMNRTFSFLPPLLVSLSSL